jgi:hypothetical protein
MEVFLGKGRFENGTFTVVKNPDMPGGYHVVHAYSVKMSGLRYPIKMIEKISDLFRSYSHGLPDSGGIPLELFKSEVENIVFAVLAILNSPLPDHSPLIPFESGPDFHKNAGRFSNGEFKLDPSVKLTIPGDYELIHAYSPTIGRATAVRNLLEQIKMWLTITFPTATYESDGSNELMDLIWEVYNSDQRANFTEFVAKLLNE